MESSMRTPSRRAFAPGRRFAAPPRESSSDSSRAAFTGNVLDLIWVTDGTTQEVNLPTHFESRDLNFGGGLGIGRFHQFDSPVRMYVSGGSRITINGDSNVAGRILASVIGQLV